MILCKEVTDRPVWYKHCESISVSGLLAALLREGTAYVTVHLFNGTAFMIVKSGESSHFYFMPAKFWDHVHHIMNVTPKACRCRLCDWRIKRGRYLDIRVFDDIYKRRI